VLLAGGNGFVEVVIFLSSTVPVIGLIWFAWWFLRAGKRYDERRAGPDPPVRYFLPQPHSEGWMF